MKDFFRVKFMEKGWIIQHSTNNIFWRTVGLPKPIFRIKSQAIQVMEELQKGESSKLWFQ